MFTLCLGMPVFKHPKMLTASLLSLIFINSQILSRWSNTRSAEIVAKAPARVGV